jgi:hypothetical protein
VKIVKESLKKSKIGYRRMSIAGNSDKSSFIQISESNFRKSDLKLKLKLSNLNNGSMPNSHTIYEDSDFPKSALNPKKVSLDLFKNKKSIIDYPTAEEISSVDETNSTFARHYPDFKTGMTPIRPQNESDLDSFEAKAQREKITQQLNRQKLYKK